MAQILGRSSIEFIDSNIEGNRVSFAATKAAKGDEQGVMDIVRTTLIKYCPRGKYCKKPSDCECYCSYLDNQIATFKSDKISVIKMKNRDIKFRGKRIGNEEWVTGSLTRINGRDFIFPDPEPEGFTRFEVDRATVGQYTELKDATDKEIWEGDILFVPENKNTFYPRIVGPVFYEEGTFFINNRDGGRRELSSALLRPNARNIGNIYDNPELI